MTTDAAAQPSPPKRRALRELLAGVGVRVYYDPARGCHTYSRDGQLEEMVLTGRIARSIAREIRERLGERIWWDAIFRTVGPRQPKKSKPRQLHEQAASREQSQPIQPPGQQPIMVRRIAAAPAVARSAAEVIAARRKARLEREIARDFASANRRGRRG